MRAVLALTIWFVLLAPAGAETPEEVKAGQKDEAEKLWKFTLTKAGKTPSLATDSFLFIGTVDAKQLEPLGKAAEKALPNIKKTLLIEDKDKLWEGYIVVHVCKSRAEFAKLFFKLKRDKPSGDETHLYAHEGNTTHVGLGPPAAGARRMPQELELVATLGSALLTRKKNLGNLPVWFVLGYGRSEAYRHAPKSFAAERAQAAMLASQGKNIYELQGDGMNSLEQLVLGASLADFLAHGGAMEKYWPDFLKNLGGDRDFYGALRETKLDADLLQKSWAAWVKNPR